MNDSFVDVFHDSWERRDFSEIQFLYIVNLVLENL